MVSKKYIDDLTYKIIGCAIEVYKQLGPGLLESVYQKCFNYELFAKNLFFRSQVVTPINYKENILDVDLRLDVLVEDLIIIELKAMDGILPVHETQVSDVYEIIAQTERNSH